MTSFSRQVKNELVRYPFKKRCCALAELRAFLQMSGKLTIGQKTASIALQTQSASIARRLFSLFKFCFEVSPEIFFCRRKQLHKNSTFLLKVPDKNNSFKILQELGFFTVNPENHKPIIKPFLQNRFTESGLKEKCCRRAYLRGSFLASGSLNNPSTPYHLEIVTPYHSYAQLIKNILASFDLEGRYFQRKDDFVVYLKGAEEIGEFLRIVSAHNALLNFENIRIVKGVRNRINRLVNCETANLTKTVFASQEQISNIRLIEETMGLKNIPPSLGQVALLRLRFPEATLQELGEMATPPLSKSSINHRLRRINALAQKIKENNGVKEKPGLEQ
jgi:DNA-binding protein WhiA